MKLETCDESDEARASLTLAALEAAGRGEGPYAKRCQAAFDAYSAAIDSGVPTAQAKARALAAMRAV